MSSESAFPGVARGDLYNEVMDLNDPDTIRRLLTETTTWAVVGRSPDPSRDSHRIAAVLQRHGIRVIPVNPAVAGTTILGERVCSSIADATASLCDPDTGAGPGLDVVDIFRRSALAGIHVDEAIDAGARAVWMQLDVIDGAAAHRAEDAGLDVVMDRCPAIEFPRLGL